MHKCQDGETRISHVIRGTQSKANTTINRRQRNGWTTEIQECHPFASRQLEEATQLQRNITAPCEQLPSECSIDWIQEGTEIRNRGHQNTNLLNQTTTHTIPTVQVTGHGCRRQVYTRKKKY